MNGTSQEGRADRKPVAAGRFYSSDRETLLKDISQLFRDCRKNDEKWNVRALIAPHAGYIFSGKIAASAYASIDKARTYKNIFLIGSSHVVAFDGASVYNTGDFITPLGKAPVNIEIGSILKSNNEVFNFPTTAHIQDHSLEVQIPLIQYYFPDHPPIVPIIIGTNNTSTIMDIAKALEPWFNDENLFVISSDFSHYPSYNDAMKVDRITAEALISGSPEEFTDALRKNAAKNYNGLSTSMCGWSSGLLLLYLAEKNKDLEFRKIDYCNSGDSPYGGKGEVVGYHSIALVNKGISTKQDDFIFNNHERDVLFALARNAIQGKINPGNALSVPEKDISDNLKKLYGAFVTLKKEGVLRGCIGRFVSTEPLYKVVQASAVSSAFEDPRFPALTEKEYPEIEIEITVLGPMKMIKDISEIIPGKHGIYIKRDFRAGTMLPQVATENNWTVEEFLGYTSRDKAGIGWDGWKTAEIYIYEGLVLTEKAR